MREVWLKPNLRAATLGFIVSAGLEALGFALLLVGWIVYPNDVLFWGGIALAAVAQVGIISMAMQMARPRIAYLDREVLFYVRDDGPVRVPLEFVEGFLLGQGPAMLPGAAQNWETSTLIAKLADNAESWQKLDVAPAVASWCNGYVTIRGTWCEPLSVEVVNRLNRRLAEIKSTATPSAAS